MHNNLSNLMTINIQLKNLDVGKTDCKNELLRNSEKQKEKFERSFIKPENINIDKFLQPGSFEYYFIMGLKGAGKTCLLRYFSLKIDEMENSHSSLIMFKSDLRDEKLEFVKASNNITKIDEHNLKSTKILSYNFLWDWIIHKHIVETIEKNNISPFKKDIYWEKYYSCVKAIINDERHRILPKIKNGNIEINAKFIAIATKLNLNFELSPSTQTVKFEQLIVNINRLYRNLNSGNDNLYILFDELELTPSPRKYYLRDSALIRDLIDTIEKFNSISLGRNGSIFLIAAIRSEVFASVASLGKEINKVKSDFGIEISWKNRSGRLIDHPLLKIIEKRIQAAEIFYGKKNITEDVWKTYFPEKIQGLPTYKYILFQTWYKPRDVVRLLLCAKEAHPNKYLFSQEVFDSTKKDYSRASWNELCEELKLSYSTDEIDTIQQILYGYKREFSYKELYNYIENLKMEDNSIESFFKKYSIKGLLDDLYRVGIIGNANESPDKTKYRFVYKGDSRILLHQKIIIHRGLWSFLCLE